MPLILGTNSIKETGYNVDNSLRFDGTSSYLVKNFSSSANRKTMTISMWIKGQPTTPTNSMGGQTLMMAGSQAEDRTQFFIADGYFQFRHCSGILSNARLLKSNRTFTDPAAWYHFVIQLDSTQGTAANRTKIFCNNEQLTSFATEQYVDQNEDFYFSFTSYHTHIGRFSYSSSSFFSGYMAEIVQLTGSAVAPTSFAEYDEDSGIWKPKDLSDLDLSSTNSFYLNFQDSSDLGNDVSGNNTDFTANGVDATNQSISTPTNIFATFNSLTEFSGNGMSEGNLKFTNSTSTYSMRHSTFALTKGKWYAEFKITQMSGGFTIVGIQDTSQFDYDNFLTSASRGYGYRKDGTKGNNNSASSFGNTFDTGDIIGVAVDLDNNKLYFSKNGTFQNSGDPTSGATGTGSAFDIADGYNYCIGASSNDAGTDQIIEANYGSPSFSISSGNTDGNGYGNFEYAVPSGYYSLNTKNLAEYG